MKLYWDQIQKMARAHHMEEATANIDNFARYLKWWWCRTYNRPMKDPMLEQYTLPELCYEYLRHYYMSPENDPRKDLEAKKIKEDEDEWIKKQMSAIAQAQATAAPAQVQEEKKAEVEESLQKMADLPDISTKFDE